MKIVNYKFSSIYPEVSFKGVHRWKTTVQRIVPRLETVHPIEAFLIDLEVVRDEALFNHLGEKGNVSFIQNLSDPAKIAVVDYITVFSILPFIFLQGLRRETR